MNFVSFENNTFAIDVLSYMYTFSFPIVTLWWLNNKRSNHSINKTILIILIICNYCRIQRHTSIRLTKVGCPETSVARLIFCLEFRTSKCRHCLKKHQDSQPSTQPTTTDNYDHGGRWKSFCY